MFRQTYVSTLRGGSARLSFTNRPDNHHYQVNELLIYAYMTLTQINTIQMRKRKKTIKTEQVYRHASSPPGLMRPMSERVSSRTRKTDSLF